MTDDRTALREAQGIVMSAMGWICLDADPAKVVYHAPDSFLSIQEAGLDANFMFGVVLPWAREQGWTWSLSVFPGQAYAAIYDGPHRPAIAWMTAHDPLDALWLALGAAVKARVEA